MIRKDTIVESLESTPGMTLGKRYVTVEDSGDRAVIHDDDGDKRRRPIHTMRVVGHLNNVQAAPYRSLSDIHGQPVQAGDYVAYAYATGKLAVFEVMSINGVFALCRNVVNNFTTTLGVFEERALKLKDYNK